MQRCRAVDRCDRVACTNERSYPLFEFVDALAHGRNEIRVDTLGKIGFFVPVEDGAMKRNVVIAIDGTHEVRDMLRKRAPLVGA